MLKIILNIDGMACGMCGSHINDAVRRNFDVKRVTSSHSKGITEIIAENPLDCERLKEIISKAGYTVTGIQTEHYEKKGFSLFRDL